MTSGKPGGMLCEPLKAVFYSDLSFTRKFHGILAQWLLAQLTHDLFGGSGGCVDFVICMSCRDEQGFEL